MASLRVPKRKIGFSYYEKCKSFQTKHFKMTDVDGAYIDEDLEEFLQIIGKKVRKGIKRAKKIEIGVFYMRMAFEVLLFSSILGYIPYYFFSLNTNALADLIAGLIAIGIVFSSLMIVISFWLMNFLLEKNLMSMRNFALQEAYEVNQEISLVGCEWEIPEFFPYSIVLNYYGEQQAIQLVDPSKMNKRKKKENDNKQVDVKIDNNKFYLPYSSATITEDTVAFLKDPETIKKCFIAEDLANLYIEGQNINASLRSDIDQLAESFGLLCRLCLQQMCDQPTDEGRLVWQTKLLNIIEAAHRSQFGDAVFKNIQKHSDQLLALYPVTEVKKDDKAAEISGVDIKPPDKVKLSNYFTKLQDKQFSKLTPRDDEYLAMNGLVAVPTEVAAIKEVINYIKSIKDEFNTDMMNVFEPFNGRDYKSNTKGVGRVVYKMDEYAKTKSRPNENTYIPSFEFMFDLIRCRCVFPEREDLVNALKELVKKYPILGYKPKLHTHLKNVTLNIQYKEVVAEVQLVYGTIKDEFQNHKLYEIKRCEFISEIHDVVKGWAKYKYEDFKEVSATIFPLKNLSPQQYMSRVFFRENFKLMRSKEFGAFNFDNCIQTQDFLESMCSRHLQDLVIQYDEKYIYGISLHGIRRNIQTKSEIIEILPQDGYLTNVTGQYDLIEGLMYLELTSARGTTYSAGTKRYTKPDDTKSTIRSFNMRVPKHCRVLGFGTRTRRGAGIQSLYCYFGEIAILNSKGGYLQSKSVLLTPALQTNCRNKKKKCENELVWLTFAVKTECDNCASVINSNDGMAYCNSDGSTFCSSCFAGFAEKTVNTKLPNQLNVTCGKGHKLVWINEKDQDSICKRCEAGISNISGCFTCTTCREDMCFYCYTHCAQRKCSKVANLPTFPIVASEFTCDKCQVKPMIWYWHAALIEIDRYTCDYCSRNLKGTVGLYACTDCKSYICSGCFLKAGKANVKLMPNFNQEQCNAQHFISWQFATPNEWTCQKCEQKFPENLGSYHCSRCTDFFLCSGCYLKDSVNFEYEILGMPLPGDDVDSSCNDCGKYLKWYWDSRQIMDENYYEDYKCKNCKRTFNYKSGIFHCSCGLDLCTGCYSSLNPESSLSFNNIAMKCSLEHLYLWQFRGRESWNCIKCGLKFNSACGSFSCKCFDSICSSCFYDRLLRVKILRVKELSKDLKKKK